MADNVPLNLGTGPKRAATDEVTYSGETADVQLVRLVGVTGAEGSKSVTDSPQATEATLAALNAKMPAAGPLTDAQLRATPVTVSGAFFQATQPVSFSWQGLTDAQLRASAVPVSFTWAGLTDAQLRASAVPVSFTWSGLTDAQLRASAVPALMQAEPAGTWPGYSGASDTAPRSLGIDDDGALIARSSVLTDEGTFRVNFANTSLAVSIGAVSIAGDIVTGSGFLNADVHYGDYIKLDADGESAWVQIGSIDSDTQMRLRVAYVGGTSGAASRALMRPVTGAGGSIAVASGACTIGGGTTANAITRLTRNVDYGPLVYRARLSLSQRIVNQTWRLGLSASFTTADRYFARFRIDGTTATSVICETGRNPTTTPSAAETETTTITLPNGLTTAASIEYRVELLTERVVFYINGLFVAEHSRVIPAQHDEMEGSVTCINGGTAPASNTNAVVDYGSVKNHNKLEIGILSDIEKLIATAAPLVPFSFTQAGVIAINTDLLVLDCSQLRSLYIQCNSMGATGVVTVQWSNTADFAQPITATLLGESGATSTTFNAAVMRITNVMGRYCRLRLTTATTAGTTTLNVWGSQVPYVPIISTQPVSVAGYPTAAASADALANPTVTKIDATNLLFNGTTWDRQRGNSSVSVEASSAKTASGNSAAAITNHNARGVQLFVNVTATSGTTPTLAVRVQVQDPVGSGWVDLPGAATASITGNGLTLLTICPGTTAAANSVVNLPLPRNYRLAWTISGTTPSFTFSVGAQYIL